MRNLKTPNNTKLKVLRSKTEIDEIRLQWLSLSGHEESDFHFFTQLLTESMGIVRPHVVAVYTGDRLEAILAGRLELTRLSRLSVGYLKIRPAARVLYFVYGGLRGDSSELNASLIVSSICQSLVAGEADVAYLNFLDRNSGLFRAARRIPGFAIRDFMCNRQRHYNLDLPPGADGFKSAFLHRVPKNRRWAKMDRSIGTDVQIRCYEKESEIDDLAAAAEQIAQNSYQRRLGVGFVDSDQQRSRLLFKSKQGWLRAYVLFIEGSPAAFWIGDIYAGVFGSDYLGFHSAFAKYSPGLYLILNVIGSISREGFVHRVDFAVGHADYKELLSNSIVIEEEVYIFAPTRKGLSLKLLKTTVVTANACAKYTMSRLGFLKWAKKRWRQHLTKLERSAHSDSKD